MDGLEHRSSPPGPSWPLGAPALEGPPRRPHRRLSPAGARAALASSLAVLALLSLHLAGVPGQITRWVHARPIYTWSTDSVSLTPPAPAWIKSRDEGLIHQAGASLSRFGGQSALDLDLSAVARAYKKLVWVEGVEQVERSYPNKVKVALQYRRPVAFAEYLAGPPGPGQRKVRYYTDRSAVLLPDEDLDPQALPPLLQVVGLGPPADANPGSAWVEHIEGRALTRSSTPDARPEAAARLAAFLVEKLQSEGWPSTSDGQPWPILAISLKRLPADRLHLLAQDGSWILWGVAPGLESPGQPSAEEKWRLLRECISRSGPRAAHEQRILNLTESRVSAQWRNPLSTARGGNGEGPGVSAR